MSKETFYNIDKIIKRRKKNGVYEYKIKWEGYPMSQCTWEPFKNLESAKELVEEYNLTHPIITQKPPKSANAKKHDFINKKRKLDDDDDDYQVKENTQNENKNDDQVKENTQNENKNDDNKKEDTQNEKIIEEEKKISDDEQKPNINQNIIKKQYIIDDTFKSVITVKQQNGKLIAIVNKIDALGNSFKAYITTEELRKSNPKILLDFYESKIRFI